MNPRLPNRLPARRWQRTNSSAGFRVAESDVLSPDVSFVRAEQLPGGRSPEGFGRFAPDLAVEVVSPGDRADGSAARVKENGALDGETVLPAGCNSVIAAFGGRV